MDHHANTSYGVVQVGLALENLLEHPERLELYRERFNQSPPPPSESPSETLVAYESPTEEERDLEERYDKVKQEREASKPSVQLAHEVREEAEAVMKHALDGTFEVPIGRSPFSVAKERVKARWIERGIWNDKWNGMAYGVWKHEEIQQIEPTSREHVIGSKRRKQHMRRGTRQVAEPPSQEERDRRASRPIHQFLYHVSRETDQLLLELRVKEGSMYVPEDINTHAYNIVKDDWTQRGIWDTKWLILPGMSWKHERPLKEFLDDDLLAFARDKSHMRQGNTGRRVHFDVSEQDYEKTDSQDTSTHWTKLSKYKKKRKSLLMGEFTVFDGYDSNCPSPEREEERNEPDSKAVQQEEPIRNESLVQGSPVEGNPVEANLVEDEPMLDSRPQKRKKRTARRTISSKKRTARRTINSKSSSKPKGIMKRYKERKAAELRRKLEEKL
ncbi:hypothetical protein GGR53DRAFT_532594 [Hypoxylon sp. FL1150]|nr:hypothetical protein GGR53DRAFT_532594 [Hypoxylon sp. FL1150]